MVMSSGMDRARAAARRDGLRGRFFHLLWFAIFGTAPERARATEKLPLLVNAVAEALADERGESKAKTTRANARSQPVPGRQFTGDTMEDFEREQKAAKRKKKAEDRCRYFTRVICSPPRESLACGKRKGSGHFEEDD